MPGVGFEGKQLRRQGLVSARSSRRDEWQQHHAVMVRRDLEIRPSQTDVERSVEGIRKQTNAARNLGHRCALMRRHINVPRRSPLLDQTHRQLFEVWHRHRPLIACPWSRWRRTSHAVRSAVDRGGEHTAGDRPAAGLRVGAPLAFGRASLSATSRSRLVPLGVPIRVRDLLPPGNRNLLDLDGVHRPNAAERLSCTHRSARWESCYRS